MIVFFFLITVVGISIYSYVLIDPNLTLMSSPLWTSFRDPMVQFGYHMREASAITYVSLLLLLFILHILIIRRHKQLHILTLTTMIGFIMLFSNPVFSHDLFSYIFDAKILTYYGQNPYTTIPGAFPEDEWLRFMHWTERSYPYGPSFLPLTLIPSFLGMGKFILHFLFFKALFVGFYIAGVYFLEKIDRRAALFIATHPLVIIEGLVNAHNDMIAVSLALIGVYFIWEKRAIAGRLILLASGGIKYLSAPVVVISQKGSSWNLLAFAGQISLIIYLIVTREIHPWYFLPLLAFAPIYRTYIERMSIFFFGLLLSYYPYIRYGIWDQELLAMKHQIMWFGFFINVIYLVYMYRSDLRDYFRKK